MALTGKEKELVAVGVSVTAGCKPCTIYHVRKALEAGSSGEEIRQAVSDAICVRSRATEIMKDYGLKFLARPIGNNKRENNDEPSRIKELVSIAAAFAVNCTSSLKEHVALARIIGISDDEIQAVIKLALPIKEKAAFHTDRAVEGIENVISLEEKQKIRENVAVPA